MRVLAIGLGAAGSQIVDHLYDHDRRSRVGCMSTLAIDIDAESLLRLRFLPDSAKVHFPSIDPFQHYDTCSTIDIEEVMTDIQKMDTIQIDAIMIFCGAGGSMVDGVSLIIPELRKSFIEPIFAVVTLPCLNEGKARSAKAADDIDMLQSYVDAIILFDNETWFRKLAETVPSRDAEDGTQKPFPLPISGSRPDRTSEIFRLIDERIARKIGLLLRAGEFNEEGLEVSEVVLDAGEVLNTLHGNGMVAVGYAAEQIPWNWLDMFDRWRSARYFIEGSQERAARIVALAKKAVYDEISIPCDLTSADKALILIAGPSRELSMKGFQTIRKWIDRSISGLEMRSGDYPVKNTRYVGIIIMLSGLKNIPRLIELQKIRDDYRKELERQKEEARKDSGKWLIESVERATAPAGGAEILSGAAEMIQMFPPDEMIILPGRTTKVHTEVKGDVIVIPWKRKRRREEEPEIVVPQGPARTVSEITRSTDGGSRFAPNDSIFGARDVDLSRVQHPKEAEIADFRLKTLPRTKDGVIDGDTIVIQPSLIRTREGIIDAETVSVASSGKKLRELDNHDLSVRAERTMPQDDAVIIVDRRLSASKIRPREPDPAKKKLSFIEREKEGKDEDAEKPKASDIFWFE